MNEKMMTDYLTLLLDQKIAELTKVSVDNFNWYRSGGYSDTTSQRYYGTHLGANEGINALKDIKSRMGLK